MITKIRLARGGKKGKPYYRLVVQCKNLKRDGKVIELLGSIDKFNRERLKWWLEHGAQLTPAAKKLLA